MSAAIACPACGNERMFVRRLPNAMLLHWVLNPGLAFNELVLGQRIPSTMFECLSCPRTKMLQAWVPCPSCGELHDGLLWSRSHSFGHWLGYFCPSCGSRIPCLWNATSRVLLVLLSPARWPILRRVRPRAEAAALARTRRARDRIAAAVPPRPNWALLGAGYAAFMWAVFCGIDLWRGSLTPDRAWRQALIWSLAGVALAVFVRWYVRRPRRPSVKQGAGS